MSQRKKKKRKKISQVEKGNIQRGKKCNAWTHQMSSGSYKGWWIKKISVEKAAWVLHTSSNDNYSGKKHI